MPFSWMLHTFLNLPHCTLQLCVTCYLQNNLSRKFKVSGIPTLVFVNGESGAVISTDGRSVVMDDPEGKDFPWAPKPVQELLSGKLTTKEGDTTWEEVHKDVDYIGIYFSAHWVTFCCVYCVRIYTHCITCLVSNGLSCIFSLVQCGPCRAFTPQLVETYKKVKKAGKKFEIIFCSSDREEESFREYYATMPWIALPFGDSRKKSLSRLYDVSGKCYRQ